MVSSLGDIRTKTRANVSREHYPTGKAARLVFPTKDVDLEIPL